MAGHSKWANIKHRKAAQDAKKGKVFTKWIREITTLTRQNTNIDSNAPLKLAIDKALSSNMSRDTIDRAIARGLGQNNEADMQRMVYEGYGLAGIAYMVVALTDNRNRTVAEVRHAFSKRGGSLGADGSVAYLFQFASYVTVEGSLSDEAMEAILPMIHDVIEDDGAEVILCQVENIGPIRSILIDLGYHILEAETGYRAQTKVTDVSEDIMERHEKLVDMLLDLDDVQEVYHTLDA